MPFACRTTGAVFAITTLIACFIGCNPSTESPSTEVCESDEAIACTSGTSCSGYKHCNQDGSAYGPCDCSLSNNSAAGGPNLAAGGANGNRGGSNPVGLGGAITSNSETRVSTGGTVSSTTNVPGTGGTTPIVGGATAASSGSSVGGTASLSAARGGATAMGDIAGAGGFGATSRGGNSPASAGTAGASTSGGNGVAGGNTAIAGGNAGTSAVSSGGVGGGTNNTRRPKSCDPDGQNCKCLNLASFGMRASASYGEGTDGKPTNNTAFETWLAEKTNARVSMVPIKPDLTADYLSNFDVILLQDLRTWTFSAEELQNVSNWVMAGGGIIALSGYFNDDDAEVLITNQVLAFSGMAYEGGALAGSIPDNTCPVSSQRLCPQTTGNCCYCWNGTVPIQDFNTNHPVTKDIKALGAYFGRSIRADNAAILATFTPSGTSTPKTVAAAKELGLGRVMAWCDEWITYRSQWSGGVTNPAASPEMLPYQPCYDAALGHWLTADNVFQTKQFWYNMITYVAPPTECDFVVSEPDVILR